MTYSVLIFQMLVKFKEFEKKFSKLLSSEYCYIFNSTSSGL